MKSARVVDWPNHENDASWPSIVRLAADLSELDGAADAGGVWPTGLWDAMRHGGATRWAIAHEMGGLSCERGALLGRYAKLAEGSLTATFILSQHDAAARRLALAGDNHVACDWLRELAEGRAFATVGLSQLTTSKRLGPIAVRASETAAGRFVIDGVIPWVTGAERADVIVAGAVTDAGQQLMFALPTARAGVRVGESFQLAALQASCTAEVVCKAVVIGVEDIIAGPGDDVMATPGAANTGGLETSALALGQARAAVVALGEELSERGADLEPADRLAESWESLAKALCATSDGAADALTGAEIRSRANALVLRSTQAYLTARKGSGFLRSDKAQRWARQALFFLVWSCPSPVANAAIREFAEACNT